MLMLELVLMLAGVVHGVDLSHAAGQVAQEARPDLRVDPFTSGQKARDFVHALTEARAVFSQDGGVCVERSCGETRQRFKSTLVWEAGSWRSG